MSWFGSVRLLSIEGRLAAAPLLIGWAWWDGGGRVASRRGVVSTRRRVLLCMLAFIYKFVKWGAARHKRHKQSRRTRGKACCYNSVSFCAHMYCVWSTTGMFTENWQQRAQGWAQSSLTPISRLSTLCSPIVWLLHPYLGTWGKLYRTIKYLNRLIYLLSF